MGTTDTSPLNQDELRLPDFLGIGAAKCGTTWLARALSAHPQIFIPEIKEVNFLDYDRVDGRWQHYAQYYQGVDAHQCCGDMSVRYLPSPLAPERVKLRMPEVRVFVVLRDPVAQINSHFHHLLRQNFHMGHAIAPPTSLRQALQDYPKGLWEPVRYGTHIVRWREVIPETHFRIFYYDDLKSEPLLFYQNVLRFLGVDEHFIPDSLGEKSSNTRIGVAPKSEQDLKQYLWIYQRLNRYVYSPLKRIMGRNMAEFLKRKLRVRELLSKKYFQSGTQPVSDQDKHYIHTKMEPELALLRTMAPKPFPAWLQP